MTRHEHWKSANAYLGAFEMEGFALSEPLTLRPSLELGVRHDGGDAETGAGVEAGGGVAFADAASGLSVEAKGRMLVTHADSNYQEWGASAAVRLAPDAQGRGFSFSLAPVIGVPASATERLWAARDAQALAPGAEFEAPRHPPLVKAPDGARSHCAPSPLRALVKRSRALAPLGSGSV